MHEELKYCQTRPNTGGRFHKDFADQEMRERSKQEENGAA